MKEYGNLEVFLKIENFGIWQNYVNIMSYKKLNKQASDFMKRKKHAKGSYRELQKSPIWAVAKEKLLAKNKKDGKLYCSHCRMEIKSSPVMHHKRYVWNDLFNPKYITFLHDSCHQRVHKIKNNYRRRKKWKK